MNFALFLAVFFTAIGIYQISALFVGLVPVKENLRISKIYKYQRERKTFSGALAQLFEKIIPLPKVLEEKLDEFINVSDVKETPRTYYYKRISECILLMLICAAGAFIVKPLLVMAVCCPILMIWDQQKKLHQTHLKIKEKIEAELPQMVATFSAELAASRDVVRILKNYTRIAGPVMKKEIEVTLSDMETGNYEIALMRMQTRLNISGISSLVRGLIGVIRGNDESLYFKMLHYDLKQQELAQIKKRVQKSIPTLNSGSILLLCAVFVIVFGVLAINFSEASATIFL